MTSSVLPRYIELTVLFGVGNMACAYTVGVWYGLRFTSQFPVQSMFVPYVYVPLNHTIPGLSATNGAVMEDKRGLLF